MTKPVPAPVEASEPRLGHEGVGPAVQQRAREARLHHQVHRVGLVREVACPPPPAPPRPRGRAGTKKNEERGEKGG